MMNRIGTRFEELIQQGEGALIVFTVAGHPDPKTSADLLMTIAEAGADIIELGVPFSDPLADGPAIQAASQRALSEGMTPAGVLELATEFRNKKQNIPLVLMTCYNPIWQYGQEKFARECVKSGVDGLIVTDLPPEEADEWLRVAQTVALDTIFLLSPNSAEARIKKVVEIASGFVYCVSRMGVTGARTELPADLATLVNRIRKETAKPIAVGFGVSRPEHVAEVCRVADGAVVGSALVSLIDREAKLAGLRETVKRFVGELKAATRKGG